VAALARPRALSVPAADPAEIQKIRRVIDLRWFESAPSMQSTNALIEA
jgi:hypothetical protein